MSIPDEVLAVMGEQVSAARHDYEICDPSDVGLHGVNIKQWREGYYEGVKDLAQIIVGRLPKEHQEYAGRKIREAFDADLAKLRELAALALASQPWGSEK